MKNLKKSMASALLITSFFGLFSCEQEEVKPKAVKKETAADAGLDDLVYKRHYLIKHNSSTMEYDVDHRLQKVNLTPNVYVQYEWYTENNSKYLSAKRYMAGKLSRKVIYSLNANNKAIKAVTTYYTVSGAVGKTETHGFEYYSYNGKLKRI